MVKSEPLTGASTRETVLGLDTLRLLAALMVVASHLALHLPVRPDSEIGSAIWRFLQPGASGRAAVAFFFVISGFCIHLAQVESLNVNAATFVARRGIRIGLPLIAVLVLAEGLGPLAQLGLRLVLWSVYCELAYYAAYPALLALRRRFSMERILVVATLVSAVFVAVGLQARPELFTGQPIALTYSIALYPLWLVGAWLAERYRRARAPRLGGIAGWRLGALALCFAANQIKLGSGPAAYWLLYVVLGLYCFFYLPRELSRWRLTAPSKVAERMGKSSYSVYLAHMIPIALFIQLDASRSFPAALIGLSIAIALISYCFYMFSEAPAHRLARAIKTRTRSAQPLASASLG